MLFNTYTFLGFFAVVYGLYRLFPARWRRGLLLLASWAFYAAWDPRFLGLLLGVTAVGYGLGRALEDPRRPHRRWLLALGVTANLGVLAAFKYLGFFVGEMNQLLALIGVGDALPVLRLLLPIGLSFYTFQSLGYLIDVYRGGTPAVREPSRFALFVGFFPQLVAGPIERCDRLLPQLDAPAPLTRERMARGTSLVLWGFYKKVFVADNLAPLVDRAFAADANPEGWLVLLGAYAFTWQIYCDFSGYTDIARGLAAWMGIDLSLNFRLPLLATSPRDLWRRWHISFSSWLRDYLYIPLGGSRRGRVRTGVNLLLTMLLGGLWHGAAWTYVLWGAFHGVALVVQRLLPPLRLGWPGKLLGIVITFHLTCLGFLVFRAESVGHAVNLLGALVSDLALRGIDWGMVTQFVAIVGLLALIELIQALKNDVEVTLRWPRPLQAALAVVLLLSILILGSSHGREFIYLGF